MFWYLTEICRHLSVEYLYLVLGSFEVELNILALSEFIISSWFYVQYPLPMVVGWFVFQRFPLQQTNKNGWFFPHASLRGFFLFLCFVLFFYTVVDERLPSDEIRFSSIINEMRRRRLPQMTFQAESLFEWGKRFFWMYFQIVSTFLRNLQGFLWETPKLFLCGFGQKYLVFSYQISKRLNSWLFWRKGNTFHKE